MWVSINGGFHKWGVSINEIVPTKQMVYFMENPNNKWMITGGRP